MQIDLYHQLRAAITFVYLIPLTQIKLASFKRPYKTLAMEKLMRILFKSNQSLKL